MDWIQAHKALAHHPKLKRLQRALGIEQPQALGHLFNLWWWATDYCKSGNLTGYTDEDWADAAEWKGDSAVFGTALVACGFIDETDDGNVLHDWDDYTGKTITKAEKDAERKRRFRAKDNPSVGCPADVHRTAQVDKTRLNRQDKTDDTDKTTLSRARPETVVALYHELCSELPHVSELTEARKRRALALLKRCGETGTRDFFARVAASAFLMGLRPGREWRADFDWIVKPEHVPKILEGSYDNRNSTSTVPGNVARALALVDKYAAEEAGCE